MAFKNFFGSIKDFSLVHIPTLALIIGLLVFWLELYVIRLDYGHVSWVGWVTLIICIGILLLNQSSRLRKIIHNSFNVWANQTVANKLAIAFLASLILGYLGIGLYASILPPHLIQESDALNYHLTLPRQHLIVHSFAHLPWSSADLFLLPLDYALSSFCLATPWPNKFIHYFFFIASLGCVYQLVYLYSNVRLRAWIAVAAILALHVVAIQVGTAMLDLVILYCFLAFVHSILTGRIFFAALEFAFLFWSKPLIPVQVLLVVLILIIAILFVRRKGFSLIEWPKLNVYQWQVFGWVFLVGSIFIALPHLIKSFYYAGTPIYLLGVGFFPPMISHSVEYWSGIVQRAEDFLNLKDSYGHGRSFLDFLKHFWLIAVPEKGVNNAFDYPLGLIYLLILCPFGEHVFKSFRSKQLPVLSVMLLLCWITWWFGSQQTRFLLIPLALMIVITIAFMPKLSKIFMVLVGIALSIEVVSLIRAHQNDWFKAPIEIIRTKDKELLKLESLNGQKVLKLNYPDAAFSSLPIDVCDTKSIFVIPQKSIICSQ